MFRLMALTAAAALAAPAAPKAFDYYVFTLSWSPEYCSDGNKTEQCTGTRRYEFVVHGLWPQYERGGYPSNCAGDRQVPRPVVDEMLEIMPSRDLIRHEWQKHGTCSGLTPQDYFKRVQDAYVLVRIPDRFKQPVRQVETTTAEVRREFTRVNAGYSFVVACRGRFVREVRTCVDKNLHSRACGAGVRDSCPSGKIILRPVR
jgi:ribonuclease T2